MELADALNELGERLGIGNIELDSNGGCLLAFDDDLLVDMGKGKRAQAQFLPCFISASETPRPHRRTAAAHRLAWP